MTPGTSVVAGKPAVGWCRGCHQGGAVVERPLVNPATTTGRIRVEGTVAVGARRYLACCSSVESSDTALARSRPVLVKADSQSAVTLLSVDSVAETAAQRCSFQQQILMLRMINTGHSHSPLLQRTQPHTVASWLQSLLSWNHSQQQLKLWHSTKIPVAGWQLQDSQSSLLVNHSGDL